MRGEKTSKSLLIRVIVAAGLGLSAVLAFASESQDAFISKLVNSSTVPSNGDLNPYGVAFVPSGFPEGGSLSAGDVLVSNFNNSEHLQDPVTPIVQFAPSGSIAPPGTALPFFTSRLAGLSTALGVLRGGFVIV